MSFTNTVIKTGSEVPPLRKLWHYTRSFSSHCFRAGRWVLLAFYDRMFWYFSAQVASLEACFTSITMSVNCIWCACVCVRVQGLRWNDSGQRLTYEGTCPTTNVRSTLEQHMHSNILTSHSLLTHTLAINTEIPNETFNEGKTYLTKVNIPSKEVLNIKLLFDFSFWTK